MEYEYLTSWCGGAAQWMGGKFKRCPPKIKVIMCVWGEVHYNHQLLDFQMLVEFLFLAIQILVDSNHF